MSGRFNELYARQNQLGLYFPRNVMICGCGGIGFWTSLFLGMASVETLYLVDPDIIELHNLNRLPVPETEIGKPKVEVLKRLILNLRPNATVIPIPKKASDFLISSIKPDVLIDCTDNLETQKELAKTARLIKIKYIRAGYDGGFSVSVVSGPPLWDLLPGENTGYSIVPSWVVPAVLAAALAVAKIALASETEISFNLERLKHERVLVV